MPFWERKPSEFDVSQDKAIKALIQNVNALNKTDQTFWQWIQHLNSCIQHLNNRIGNLEAAIQSLHETVNVIAETIKHMKETDKKLLNALTDVVKEKAEEG